MGEGEEIAEQFLRFPGMLNASEMRDYEDLYHPDFQAILPSVCNSCKDRRAPRDKVLTFLTAAKTWRGVVFYFPRRVAFFTEGVFEWALM